MRTRFASVQSVAQWTCDSVSSKDYALLHGSSSLTTSVSGRPGQSEPGSTSSWHAVLFFVALAATATLIPMFFLGNASGHDFQFHLASWMDVAGQWREGVIFPRWAEWANWGLGEPRFIFYPPASWLLGGALWSIMPGEIAPEIYIWLALIAAGMSMWKLSREWLPERQAASAAVLFAVNPYNLVIVYYRSDFSELLAGALFPLLVWGVWQIIDEGWRRVPLLAIIFAGIWLSNAPAAVIATYSLVLLLVVACVCGRNLKPMVLGGTAATVGFGLAAFYIFPALWEQRWVQIVQAISTNLQPGQNFIFTGSDNPEFLLFNWKISAVALGMILVTSIAAVFSARRRREFPQLWWILFMLGAVCVFLIFRPSALVWRHLPELAFVQFPWRWLEPLGVVFAFFLAASIGLFRARMEWWLAMAVLLSAVGTAGVLIARDTWWNGDDVPFLADAIGSGHGYEGTDEYTPIGADRYQLPGAIADSTETPTTPPNPRVARFDPHSEKVVPAEDMQFQVKQWSAERKIFLVQADESVTIALRVLNYPAWEVRVDGFPVRATSASVTDQLLLALPRGDHLVDARFRRTWDRSVGDSISVFSAVILVAFACIFRKRRPAT